MNFNHDTGTIDTILVLDTTAAPPLGGTTNSLRVLGTGSVFLPQGNDAARPANATGQIRYNTTSNLVEFNNGSTWNTLSVSGTGVSSVAVTGSTGLAVSGSPITSSGTITLTLDGGLQTLASLATTGVIVQSAADTFTSRAITGTTSNITVTNGDGVAGNPTINLATVTQGSTGTSFVKVQLDTFGRVINNTAVVAGDITTLVDGTYVNVSGDTMSSGANLTFTGGGTVTGLPTPSNASDAAPKSYVDSISQGLDVKSSVRAATTAAGTLASSFANASVIDGVTLATNDRILIKNQAAPAENGIYTVNASGAPTRAVDMDVWTEVPGAFVWVEEGTVNADTGWVSTANQGGTLNTTAITWSQFGGIGTYTAGAGLTLSGNQFSLTTPVAIASGGTGLSTTPTNGQLLIGNGTNYTLTTLSQGAGITVTNGVGSITVANAGVTSFSAGTTGLTPNTGTTGAVTLAGTLGIANGGTGLTATPTNGQIDIGNGTNFTRTTLTQGTGITVTNGAGSITIANAGVTSNVAGTGISVSSATGAVTINNTGVLSFSQTVPSFLSITGASTATGAVSSAITLASQTANTAFLAPNGSSGTPTFRSIAFADLTTALQLYRENPSTPTTPSATGTNSVALGTGSAASATDTLAVGSGSAAALYGAKAFSNGSFGAAGDAQFFISVLRGVTTDATVTELFADGSTQRLLLPNKTLWTFSIYVAGRRQDTSGGGAGYRLEGVIRRDASVGTTTLTGAVSKTILGETNAAWDVTVSADTTNGALLIQVTGEAAKTIRWVATAQITQVVTV